MIDMMTYAFLFKGDVSLNKLTQLKCSGESIKIVR